MIFAFDFGFAFAWHEAWMRVWLELLRWCECPNPEA